MSMMGDCRSDYVYDVFITTAAAKLAGICKCQCSSVMDCALDAVYCVQ